MEPLIIIGTGLAGYNLAKEFRKLNTEQELCLITAHDGSSYSKPMLSNAFEKNKTPQQLVIADANKMANDLDARIITNTRVTKINSQEKNIHLDNDERLRYSKLVIAAGATPNVVPVAGNAVDDMFYVNSLQDYEKFYPVVSAAQSIVIIGPGLIGCEFANDLVTQGKEITVIGPNGAPLDRLLPAVAGEYMQNKLTEAGINWQLQTAVKRIDKVGKQYNLQLDTGEMITVDVVLSAIGLTPDIKLASDAGLKVDCGIVVDRHLKTSTDDIYALGDCIEIEGHVLPFIMPIMHASRALAKTLAGEATQVSYPAMPILVKTPACPTIISPPAKDAEGEWQVEATETGVCAKFIGTAGQLQNQLLGFALLGDATQQRQALTKELPAVL